jgi:hypothetical protein
MRSAHAHPRQKLSFPIILGAIQGYASRAEDPVSLDRKRVLGWLCAEWDCKPEALLLRGFDRAYRLVIEGV